jgi:hypothetical protein
MARKLTTQKQIKHEHSHCHNRHRDHCVLSRYAASDPSPVADLRTQIMSAHIIEEASITVPILGSNLSEDEIVLHPDISASLYAALVAMRAAVVAARSEAATVFSIGHEEKRPT